MRRGMFRRLAATNIKKNREVYLPYMLTCMGVIAIFYMMFFIARNPGLEDTVGGSQIQMIIPLGIVVIGIFSCIFFLCSNGFLMKRRQKEIGLYNILGLEKRHIARMMAWETVMVSFISLAGGIALGILGSKLGLLLLLKLLRVPAQFGFYVSGLGILACVLVFGGIFFLTLIKNLRQIQMSRPVELLLSGKAGEREPKAKWLMALLGFVCLGGGYYLAVTTEYAIDAIGVFFVAVLLVMAGTILLFTSGSIAILKMLRWKKSFYYKTKNFTSISGMLYRMKQNAVGLANICILSTGVLLLISTTVCLEFGAQEILKSRYPYEITMGFRDMGLEELRAVRDKVFSIIRREDIPCDKVTAEISQSILGERTGEEQIRFISRDGGVNSQWNDLTLIPAKEYGEAVGSGVELKDGELLLFNSEGYDRDSLFINDREYQVKECLDENPLSMEDTGMIVESFALVVTDNDFQDIIKENALAYGGSAASPTAGMDLPDLDIGIDIDGTEEDEIFYGKLLGNRIYQEILDSGMMGENSWMVKGIRAEQKQESYAVVGGLFFLGLFLGGVFLMGTAMLIYYKQISEGYEDKARFEIMRKVGMSRKEVKASIRRQILMIFFLPLLMACLHIVMAFPLMRQLLGMFRMDNVRLFAGCTVGTAVVFGIVYALIYALTARAYYRILDRAE